MATASDAEQLQKQAVAPAPVTSSEPIQSSAQSRSLAKTDAQGPRSDSSHRKVSGHLRLDTHELYDGSLGNGSGGIGGRTRSDRTSVLSFSRRAAQIGRTPTPFLVEGDRHLLRDIERPPPGDPRTRLHANRRSLSQEGDAPASAPAAGRNVNVSGTIARKRSQYFEEAFSTRDADASLSKERVGIETPVLAKVQTNVLVGDEFTFVTGLSAHLALRYRRPLTSIIVTLRHGACMCFGGSFAPAYVMTVSALPAQLQPVTNKHNAALIQRHMEQTLGVPPARGYLQFVAVPEANLAYGGKTAMGHTHHGPAKVGSSSLSKSASYSPNGMYPSPTESTSPNPIDMAVGPEYTTESRKSSLIRRLSVKSLSSFRVPSPLDHTPPRAVSTNPLTALAALPAIAERSTVEPDAIRIDGGSQNSAKREQSNRSPGKEARPSASETQGVTVPASLEIDLQMASPTPPVAMGRQSSNRVGRSKSFVATLFGRSATRLEGSV